VKTRTESATTAAPPGNDASLEVASGRLSSGMHCGICGGLGCDSEDLFFPPDQLIYQRHSGISGEKGREIFVAAAYQRKVKVAKKYDSLKDECHRLQEERLHKLELVRRRKEERDSKRYLVNRHESFYLTKFLF